MKLLHPIMPFITEEVWNRLPHDGESIMISAWPSPPSDWIDGDAEAQMDALMDVIRSLRSTRADLGIAPATVIDVSIRPSAPRLAALREAGRYIARLAKATPTFEAQGAPRPPSSVGIVLPETEVHLSVRGVLDTAKEYRRIGKIIERLDAEVDRLQQRLRNEEFVARAPADVVERERERLAEMSARRARLAELLTALE